MMWNRRYYCKYTFIHGYGGNKTTEKQQQQAEDEKKNNKLLNPCTNLIEFVSLFKMSRYNFILINFCAKSA